MSEQRKDDPSLSGAAPGLLESEDTVVDPTPVFPPDPPILSPEEEPKANVAARGALLFGDEEEDDDIDDAEVDRLVSGLDRRIAAGRAGPKTVARSSNGGANVAYAATAEPILGRRLRDPTGKVVFKEEGRPKRRHASTAAELEAPTVLVERVLRRARTRRRAWMALAGLGLLIGGTGVIGVLLSEKAGSDHGMRSSPSGERAAVGVTDERFAADVLKGTASASPPTASLSLLTAPGAPATGLAAGADPTGSPAVTESGGPPERRIGIARPAVGNGNRKSTGGAEAGPRPSSTSPPTIQPKPAAPSTFHEEP